MTKPLNKLHRGLLCLVIGAAVLLAPVLVPGASWSQPVAQGSWVGYVAIGVGLVMLVLHFRRKKT